MSFLSPKLLKLKIKKIRISTVIVLSNLTAAADIGIILIFASIITGSFTSDNPLSFIVQFFLDYKIFIPLIVVARFTFVFATSIIMKKLEYEISENIRIFFLQQIFNRSNYSVSDAYFYINTLTGHITFFYAGFAAFINGDHSISCLCCLFIHRRCYYFVLISSGVFLFCIIH